MITAEELAKFPDTFNGDDAHLVRCIEALLSLDATGTLVPHGIGGHARGLLSAAMHRLVIQSRAAGVQGAGEYPHEHMDALAADRYKVVPTNSGFWPFCVTAGDGERQLYKGNRGSCVAVAGQLTTAFQDGGFAATAMLATPQPPKDEGAVDDAGERAAFEKWLSGFPNPPPLTRVGEKQTYSYATTLSGWNAWMQRAVLAAAGMGQTAWRADAVPLLDASFAAFDEITGLCSNLRQGGPAPEDLESLSTALDSAIDIAAKMMIKISEPPAEPAARAQVVAGDGYRHSTHHVHKGPESLPCYCGATMDHQIGEEQPNPSPAHAGPGAEALASEIGEFVEFQDGSREWTFQRDTLATFARRLKGGDHA